MDRARARRENLEKKLTEQTGPRKRPMPLGDHNEQVVDTSSTSQDDDYSTDDSIAQDSPKRQCVRKTELNIKADTPAIQSVQSRRDVLATSHTFGIQKDEDDYVPPLRRRHDALLDCENSVPVPVAPSRRNRLAALASTINNWEDDLSHPRVKPPEEKKRGWQPPKGPEPVNENESKKNKPSQNPDGPSKPPRTYEYENPTRERSPQKTSNSPKKTVVSSLTVNIGGASPKPSQIQFVTGSTTEVSPSVSKGIDFVPGTTTAVSPSVKVVGSTSNLNRSPQPFRRGSPLRASGSPAKKIASPKAVNTKEESAKPHSLIEAWKSKEKANTRRDSDVNEPTKQPVAARMGLWENKITEAEKLNKPTSPIKPGTRAVPKAPRPQSAVVMREKSGRGSERDPTEESVHNRMSLWEKRVTENQNDKSPTMTPRPVSADFKAGISQRAAEMQGRRTSPKKAAPSVVKSPEKVGPATKTLAGRLAEMEKGWQRNEIAEKIKADKEKDMAMLQNRWRNGMPSDGHEEKKSTPQPAPVTVTPQPAPPPPPLPASTQSPAKNSPVSTKREVYRQKVRGDFENKLRAMGFDVHGSTDVGKVAVVDLTPHKEKEIEDKKKNIQSPKKNNIQLKVVEVEDSRTTTTTFGDSKVSMKNSEGPGTHVSSVTTTLSTGSKPQSNKTSIYQLIKNKGASSQPAAYTRPPPDDSFDSGDSYDDEEEEPYSDQESEAYTTEPEQHHVGHAASRHSVHSVSSETSERTDYTETEDNETEYTEEYTEDDEGEEDEDYSDEESEEEDEDGNVDDLLDEVMDDTMTTETESEAAPVPKPRQYPVHSDHRRYDRPPSDRRQEETKFRVPQPGNVPMRRKDNRVTFSDSVAGGSTSSQTTSSAGSSTSGGSASESESDIEKPVVYSIDMYRKSNSHRNNDNIPKMTIVRHSEHAKRASTNEEPLPYIPEKPVRQRLQELQDMVNQEQNVIQQTSNALNQCCGTNSNFANSIEAVECHRLLLIACKKREGYLAEMERLRNKRSGGKMGPSGSLTISDIRIPLKKDFTQKIGTQADLSQHFFVCLLRNGAQTIVSQMVSTHDAMVRDTLDIPNMFKISEIRQDFKITLEIYSMSISKEQNILTPKKKQKTQTPKKGLFGGLKPSTPRSMQSPGGPNAVRTTNFSHIADLPITLKCVNKSHFGLERMPYSTPLQGTIHVKLQCVMESAVEEKGFLTMFEDVGGFGAWHRRWCVLRNNVLSYWKYPDDENIKEPIGYIELKMCITERVGLIPRDICARPHTFELVSVRRQHKGDSNTLITKCSNTMTSTRHQLSADTKEDRVIWCDALNKALNNLRLWNSDALRPVKMQ